MHEKPAYRRIILKLSGEALSGDAQFGIDPKTLDSIAREIGALVDLGVQVGVVIGGGNFFRGQSLAALGIERITADHVGMLGTLMNALAMRDAIERANYPTRVMSAIPMSGIVDHYDRRKAMYHLAVGQVVLFAAGTGNPLVTTDSAASLRAIEVQADLLLKATHVDGIYDADPKKNPDAKKYSRLTYTQALTQELGIMDLSAFTQCRDHQLKIIVFNLNKPKALLRIVKGEDEGTLVM